MNLSVNDPLDFDGFELGPEINPIQFLAEVGSHKSNNSSSLKNL